MQYLHLVTLITSNTVKEQKEKVIWKVAQVFVPDSLARLLTFKFFSFISGLSVNNRSLFAPLLFSLTHPPLPLASVSLQLVLPEYSIHGLFCIMFLCAQEWLTVGLNIPLLFYNTWR